LISKIIGDNGNLIKLFGKRTGIIGKLQLQEAKMKIMNFEGAVVRDDLHLKIQRTAAAESNSRQFSSRCLPSVDAEEVTMAFLRNYISMTSL